MVKPLLMLCLVAALGALVAGCSCRKEPSGAAKTTCPETGDDAAAPKAFEFPLVLDFPDIPAIPEEIRDPSPPIEKEEQPAEAKTETEHAEDTGEGEDG
jgi:hypothetical protein